MIRIAETKFGKIEGLPAADPRITSFKGIPFAMPPVGKLRFHAPVPLKKRKGTLQAYKFAPIAVQPTPYYDPDDLYCREWSVDKDIPMSEDCLYLNIWTPYDLADKDSKKLPVYVWIYGGGFQTGYTSEMEFDGERIARRNIVVVTLSYRLNMFGFMCHPEITAENPNAPANFGLLDQRMAIQWVKDNIEAFGGDSNNITIGGQSAGGASVLYQIQKGAENLFKRAVCHSGMIYMPDNPVMMPKSLCEAEKIGQEFFEFCGAKNLKQMRKFTTQQLRKKWDEYGGHEKSIQIWTPVCDNKFVYADFFTALQNNRIKTIPLFLGYTTDEFCFPDKNGNKISTIKTAIEKYQQITEEKNIKNENYCYQFDVDIPGDDNPGKFHSVDLWFWFETLAKCRRPFAGKHYDIAKSMCDFLCNFIKTGNPNKKDCDNFQLPLWKKYSSSDKNEMKFFIQT